MPKISDKRRPFLAQAGPIMGFVAALNIAAATTTGAIAQLGLTGANPISAASLVSPAYPRNVVLTITDANASITQFDIRVTGTAPDGTVVTERFQFAGGLVQTGSVIFATITAVTVVTITGDGAGDVLDMGYGVKLGLPIPKDATELTIRRLLVDAAVVAASATDQVENSFTSATAPNGARDFEVWFSYV